MATMPESKQEQNAFEKLDKTLGEYYKSQGVAYFDPDDNKQKEGKFLLYCDENGFELDDIDEEFQNDAADCIYCDFDENFPIDKTIKVRNEDERIEEIFNVIKYCYENNTPPKYFSTLNLTLDCDKNDIKIAENKYTAQCPKIFHSQEETLKKVFAIGLKNDFPFISYLVDAYQRDRMLSVGKDLNTATWAKESPYMKKITAKSKTNATTIESGIQTYMKRVAPRFHWKAMNKIQDDIEPIIKYFIAAGQFIEALLQKGQTPPFAYDVVIVVRKAISTSNMVIPEGLSGSEDDDDDEEEDDDFKHNESTDDNNKYLQGIEEKLEDNNCTYVGKELPADKRGARFLMVAFNEFTKKLGEDKYKNKGKGSGSGYNMSEYPRKKRFCTMIDRRGDDVNKDSMIMFEPPDDSNTLPDKHVPDWYFNAGKTCIVPSKGYSNGGDGSFDAQDIVCVDRAYKGQVITISFHVDSSASVRCYLFWNGCYIRIIYPSDLIVILNSIFDTKYKGNAKYLQTKIKDDIIKLKVVKDDTFDAFYKEVKIKK